MTAVTVIGGTGKTGREISTRLARLGHDVRSVSRSTTPAFDWRDPATWPAVVDGSDAAYLIADEGAGGVDRLQQFVSLCRVHGVARVVLLSARDWIDTDMQDGLAREQVVRDSGLEWTILQPAWFAQNFDAPGYFAKGIREGRLVHASGGGRCPFVDARDIAAVATAALVEPVHHQKEYALSGPAAITMDEVALAIGTALDRVIVADEVELADYERHLASLGYSDPDIHAITYLDRAMRAGELDHVSDGVRQAIGRSATPFTAYAMDYASSAAWRPLQ